MWLTMASDGYYNGFMSAPVLATKLYIPSIRPKAVLRPRLIKRLASASSGKLTLVSAPPGFGKTTLVSKWIHGLWLASDDLGLDAVGGEQLGKRVAWLSLDEGDKEPARFLVYLVAALQTVLPTIGEGVLRVLQSPLLPQPESILTLLLNEIVTIPGRFVLVLDDYHLAETPWLNKALTFLLEHQPPQMHLVITTRRDPPLLLARLRVRGQLTEVRAADLRFTLAETAEFLNQVMGLDLSAEEVTTLEARTEGWIAGLQLAALSLQRQKDTTNFIQSFTGSHHFVLDYLVQEVWQQQPQPVQTFLLHTSILDRLCGPLCDAVLPEPAAIGQETLEYLERANLFVVPLDDKRHWYRYHHLFADVLQTRLMKTYPNQVRTLHQWACEWYEENGLRPDAVGHALAAEDFERAAELIERAWFDMQTGYFQHPIYLEWVKALPDEMVRRRPLLSLSYAWELLGLGELVSAETLLQVVEQWLESIVNMDNYMAAASTKMVVADEKKIQFLQASVARARAFHAQAQGDISATVEHAQWSLRFAPEADYLGRGSATALLGLAQYAQGDLGAAYRLLTESMALQMTGNIHFAISTTFLLADIRVTQGRLLEAIAVYEQSLQTAAELGESLIQGTADLYIGLSDLHHEQGHGEIASQHLLRAEELVEQVALPVSQYRLCLVQARRKRSQGDLVGALNLLDEAARLYYQTPLPNVRPVAALKARVWLEQGQLSEVWIWVHERGLSVDDKLCYLDEFEHITLARLLIAQYKDSRVNDVILEAIGLLQRLLNGAERGERGGSMIELFILLAMAYQAQGNIPAALISLQQALTLAEPEGYVRIFIDEGGPMVQLLSEAIAHLGKLDYINKLLLVFETKVQKGVASAQGPESELLLESLTPREREVLQLLAAGHSNPEIAARLVIAVTTVKTHVKNIYGKLQVTNRFQAVARVKDLNLL